MAELTLFMYGFLSREHFTFAITCSRVTNSNDGDASHSFADDVQALKREYFPISVGYSNALIDSEDAEFIQV